MKLTFVALATAVFYAPSIFALDLPPIATKVEILDQNELYLGSVRFSGGILSRGSLDLQRPTDMKSLRFEAPDFCQTRVLEAGTVSAEGTYFAQRTSNPSVFLVNSGRGLRARSIFVSLEGPQNIDCYVLVYANPITSAPLPPPNNGEARAVTCVTNQLPVSFTGNIVTDGSYQGDFSIPSGRTTMFVSRVRSDGSSPLVRIGYDSDLTSGYSAAQTTLSSTLQITPDCRYAPKYTVRHYNSDYLEVVRQ